MVNELTEKDKIEHFKRECLSMRYYQGKLQETNEKLEEISVRLSGVSSPAFKEVVLENARNSNRETRILQLMMEEDELRKERDYWKEHIRFVEESLSRIEEPLDRQLIYDLFINRKKKHKEVARKYYLNRQNMYKKVDKIISSII